MFRSCAGWRLPSLSFTLVLLFQGLAGGEILIRLDGLPERLAFPLPDGTNRALTATVTGGDIRSVWLAPSATTPSAQRVSLTKVAPSEYLINLGGREVYEALRSQGPSGEFRVFAEGMDGAIAQSIAARYTMHVMPLRLDFPWDQAKMTIYQRSSKTLPGSKGDLSIRIGDITAGQVLVTVYGPDSEALVDTTSMREGDAVCLPLAEQKYVLSLDQMVNLLIGDDYAVFSVTPAESWEGARINRLLHVVAESDLTFIRNEQEWSGEQFAAHLRQKSAYYGLQSATVEEFIDKVASQSSATGRPYRVRLSTGETVETSAWLHEQAATIPRMPLPPGCAPSPPTHETPCTPESCLEPERFGRFLNAIQTSGATFTFAGSDSMSGAGFAISLRAQLVHPNVLPACLDTFIERYTNSLEALGNTYQVRLRDGRTGPAAAWLRRQAEAVPPGSCSEMAQDIGSPLNNSFPPAQVQRHPSWVALPGDFRRPQGTTLHNSTGC